MAQLAHDAPASASGTESNLWKLGLHVFSWTSMATESEIFELLGKTVFVVQQVERTIVVCLMISETYEAGEGDLRKILKQDKATLGKLISYLSKAVPLPEDFSERFRLLVERRNLLFHKFIMEEWVDTRTDKGRIAIHAFLQDLLKDALHVMLFLRKYSQSRLGREVRSEVLDYAFRYHEAAARTVLGPPSSPGHL